jgi:uncharacterized protein (DUF1800 family)
MSEANRKAFHLLNRMGYGPRPGEVDELAKGGEAAIQKWIDAQLNPKPVLDTGITERLKACPLLGMSIEELHMAIEQGKGAGAEMKDPKRAPRRILLELAIQKLVRAVESKQQFQEVLDDFWFNHFNVDFTKGQVKWYLIPYVRDVIRPRMFGRFRDLLGAVAKSPAMLFYLDNFQSVREGLPPPRWMQRAGVEETAKRRAATGLNENYGRELLELHTLGVDGGYVQNDVRESARALTGWSLDQPRKATAYRFFPKRHDPEAKRILNLPLAAGGGEDDGEKLLDMLASHPSTAHFIAKKLCVKFIADHPPESAIKKLAAVFLKTDGDLRAVYKELFALPEFWAESVRRTKIKTPWEFVVSGARALGATVEVSSKGPPGPLQVLEQMGEPIYRCQPPTGFKATAENWVNPGALVTRINFGLALASGRYPVLSVDRERFQLRLEAEQAHDISASVERLAQWLLAGELSDAVRKRLEAELEADEKVVSEAPSHHMTVSLAKMLGLVLGSPEFQRR